jgi:hypothetical protein
VYWVRIPDGNSLIVITLPQIHNLPLMGLDELKDKLPDVAAKLGEGDVWTPEAEEALIER